MWRQQKSKFVSAENQVIAFWLKIMKKIVFGNNVYRRIIQNMTTTIH